MQRSYVTLSQPLPQCDHTKSTNYGSAFELYTALVGVLRCCAKKHEVSITINDQTYAPWDDLVVKQTDATYCFQLKHTVGIDKRKLKKCLKRRSELPSAVTFVYFTTASGPMTYPRVESLPEILRCFVSNDAAVYRDADTYFCMSQNDVAHVGRDVHDALAVLVGEATHSLHADLKRYVHDSFFRGHASMTSSAIARRLGRAALDEFRLPSCATRRGHVISPILKRKIRAHRIIVLNHRPGSGLCDNVRKYLVKGRHAVVVSPTRDSDAKIWRAVELLNYDCHVVVLRTRTFRNDVGRSLLAGVAIAGMFRLEYENETFCYAEVETDAVTTSLHVDLFARMAVDNETPRGFRVLEALDEVYYVNDAVPLATLVQTAPVDFVADLIERGADPNAAVADGLTALHLAVACNRVDVVDALLRRGALPDPVNGIGKTPLFDACVHGHVNVIELLLKHGANRYAADARGDTPAAVTRRAKQYEALRLLLRNNERLTAANAAGGHILHEAAFDGDVECLKCVIETHTRLDAFMTGNADGKTPKDVARDAGHVEFLRILTLHVQTTD